jgi:FG-GAP-like repeat
MDPVKTKQRLFTFLFVVSTTCLVLASSANAAPGVRFWSMNVGNHWVYDESDSGGATWTSRDEVAGIDTTTIPGVTTYKVERRKNGLLVGYQWFSTSLAELTERRELAMGDIGFGQEWITLAYDSGLVFVKNPIMVGAHWVTQTTATLSGEKGWSYPFDISLDITIQAQEFITVPLGTYKAYKFQQILHFWNDVLGIDQTETQYGWFVPYLGLVKSQDTLGNVGSLASLSIRKGIIDFDSDAKTDITVYRASTGAWYVFPSGGGASYGFGWGGDPSDKPIPGDYDGDGKTDMTVYRASTGAWYVYPSGGGTPYGFGWGGDPTDKPIPRDYDGDGKTDMTVYRASTGAWYVYPSGGGAPYGFGWGGDPSDKPIPGDYDGDGKTDMTVYRTSTGAWYVYPSGGGTPYGFGWGGDPTDKPIPGDYDGDGKTDIAVYRANTGGWYVYPSGGGSPYGVGWGGDISDIPLATNPD